MRPSTGLFDTDGQAPGHCAGFVGGLAELEVIGALISAVAHGRGGVLVIEGPPAFGATLAQADVAQCAFATRSVWEQMTMAHGASRRRSLANAFGPKRPGVLCDAVVVYLAVDGGP